MTVSRSSHKASLPRCPKRERAGRKCGSRSGFVLLATIWITAMLSVVALGYASTARLKALLARNGVGWISGKYELQSALILGEHEYQKYNTNKALLDEKEEVEGITGKPLVLWFPRYESYEAVVDNSTVYVNLANADAKLNVNGLTRDEIILIAEACEVVEDDAEALADSIQDWIDTDQNHRLNGAENDYYESLDPPYQCKDGAIESLEELLLIRNITPEIFYGGEDRAGLVDFLTYRGNATAFDVNCCSPKAFRIIDDFPLEAVDGIIEMRAEAPIKDINELSEIVPQKYYSQFVKYFTVANWNNIVISVSRGAREKGYGASLSKLLQAGGGTK